MTQLYTNFNAKLVQSWVIYFERREYEFEACASTRWAATAADTGRRRRHGLLHCRHPSRLTDAPYLGHGMLLDESWMLAVLPPCAAVRGATVHPLTRPRE